MVNKSKIIILTIFIFSLAFLLFLAVFPENSLACRLVGPNTYFQNCYPGNVCSFDSECGSGEVLAYDFGADLGGCVMGYAAGKYYKVYCDIVSTGTCGCKLDAQWYTSPTYDGQVCKRRSGPLCISNVKEGNWDSDESKCVVCDGPIEKEYFSCSGDYTGNSKCESACGADPICDERERSSFLPDICGTTRLEVYRYCNYDCKYSSIIYTCDASQCGVARQCGGLTYYCVYDNGWKWSTTKPSNFCCSNNDCPSKNDIKGKCDSPYGTDNPDTPGYTYTCYLRPCKSDGDCVSGTYCYCGVCSPTFTSAGCDSGKCCNRGYGEGVPGSCVSKGTIYNSGSISYLCDPPEWNSNYESKSEKNIFEFILSFFYSFFQR
jgi:hypothetical protein